VSGIIYVTDISVITEYIDKTADSQALYLDHEFPMALEAKTAESTVMALRGVWVDGQAVEFE
jgi:hypothetical protein